MPRRDAEGFGCGVPITALCFARRASELFEARIAPERIEHWIEPEQRRSKRLPPVAPLYGVARVFSLRWRWRDRLLTSAPPPERRTSIATGTIYRVFLYRIHGHRPLRPRPSAAGFVTEPHIRQREISNQSRIFRLFFEKSFQFAVRFCANFSGRRHDRP